MGYEINLRNISIFEYKEILKKQNLISARRVLQENVDERFGEFLKCGIKNVAELYEKINDSQMIAEMSDKTGLQLDYLVILKKEILNINPKPILIADFPHIQPATFKRLGECCVQTSKDFFELSDGGRDINAVCSKTGISEEAAAELGSLCDLIRINGVGPVFARVLFEAGYRSIVEIADSDAETILEKVTEINTIKKYTRVLLNRSEIQLCIDFAKLMAVSRNACV